MAEEKVKIIPRPQRERLPVILCVSSKPEEDPEIRALILELKNSGREVIVAHRPLCCHPSGRSISRLESIPRRLNARGVHWIGVGRCAKETFDTISSADGVASVTLLMPRLDDSEPSYPGKPGVPKLLIQKSKKKAKTIPSPSMERFIGNVVGPVEVKVLPRKTKEEGDDLPLVVMEFLDKVEGKPSST